MPTITPYMVTPDHPGFTPNISRLVSMMNYARQTTLQMVQGLTSEELDHLPDPKGNSIGMLLEHICAVEVGYQGDTFGGNGDEAIGERWKAGADLGDLGREQIRGHGLRYYLENLKTIRAATFSEFAKRDDVWLEETIEMWGTQGNRFFMWFHVLEDEINHRGQIRLLWKQLPRMQNIGRTGLVSAAATSQGLGMRLLVLHPHSPAAKAGLQEGDVVLEFASLVVPELMYEEIPLYQPAGIPIPIKVQRGQDVFEASLTPVLRR